MEIKRIKRFAAVLAGLALLLPVFGVPAAAPYRENPAAGRSEVPFA